MTDARDEASALEGPHVQRRLALSTAAVVVTIGFLAPQLAGWAAETDANPQAQLEQVRAQQAQVASDINAQKASLSQIDQALQVLDTNVRTQEGLLADAQQAETDATQRADEADAAVSRITGERVTLRRAVQARAVSAFVNPPSDDLFSMFQTKDISEANDRKLFIELRAQSDSDLADRLQGLDRDLVHERGIAHAAKAEAGRKRAEQRARTVKVEEARAQERKLAGAIQAVIDRKLSQSISLAKTNKALSYQIALQEAALQARLAQQRAAAAAAARRPLPSGPPVGPGGSETGPLPPVPTSGGPAGGLSTVGGITVASQIAGQLGAMLNAARADGLVLTGSGYRDPAAQIRLREAHCGTSYYAIYQMSPSACHPPTAIPGSSMHEVGLAIDFSSCSSHGTACWQWLSGHASSFGFYNLPSEPWHWSINGH